MAHKIRECIVTIGDDEKIYLMVHGKVHIIQCDQPTVVFKRG